MKAKSLIILAVIGLMAVSITAALAAQPPKMKMTTDIPASITAPDRVETSIGTLNFFDGVPTEKTVDTVYGYLDRSRAVNVFINSIPMPPPSATPPPAPSASSRVSRAIWFMAKTAPG